MNGFFYGQTEYNYLENVVSLNNYISLAKEYDYNFLTITDKNMHAYYKFYNLCIENNIKPIIGLKITLLSESTNDFILAYAKNNNGLKELFKLTKYQEMNKGVTMLELKDNCNDLVLVTCEESSVNIALINNEKNDESLKKYYSITDDFYIGITNDKLIEKCLTLNLKYLPLAQTLYLYKEDYIVYKTVRKINGIKEVNDFNKHIKNKEELKKDFNENAFKYVEDVVSSIKYENFNKKVDLPIYDINMKESKLYLEELATKGLQRRLQINNKTNLSNEYLTRLKFELEVIHKMGYNDYFLIVWDFIKFAKKNDILVGPGRGSAAGSLTSYCLGITEIDPLEYDLLFERFLNPQRISLPDIDIDFPDFKRESVIQYVKNKYGENHVCYISTFSTFGVKTSIRDICKANNVNLEHANLMLHHIEKFGIEDALEKYQTRDELIEVLTIANKISGLVRHTSTHAAGIILSSLPLDENLPLKNGVNGVYQSQIEAEDLEKKGFLKIDFLGIRNLTLIEKMKQSITDYDSTKLTLNDKKTYELLSKGDTNGVFQLESNGIKNVLRKLKPSNFNDIVSVLALYRPGPMDNIDLFIQRKQSKKIEYITKELEPILKETYGIIVYQEQIMQIANVISNYTYSEADLLRRAVSKKDKKVLDENRKLFIDKAILNNKSEKIANEIYDLIVKFANYGFNKSHSVAYAKLSYEMAYLKANFTTNFVSVMLENALGDYKELNSYISYAKDKNIKIISPKINHSTNQTMVINGKILLPLTAISKLSNNVAKMIVDERDKSKFTSLDDFKERTNNFLPAGVLDNIIFCGALDEFNMTKKSMSEKVIIDPIFQKYNNDTIISTVEYTFEELKEKENQALGFNINYDLFKINEETLSKYKYIKAIDEIELGKNLTIVSKILTIKEIKTKTNESMAFLELDLNFTKMEAVVFPSSFPLLKQIDENKLVVMKVNVQLRQEELKFIINEMKNI